MNIIHREKKQEPQPLVPVVSRWKVPFHRHLRGKRYNGDGECVADTGPLKRPDPIARENLLRAQAEAATKPPPEPEKPFDLDRFRPLPRRILLQRPPQITEENGIALPENKWHSPPWFTVLKVGDRVTECAPGDRVIFNKNHRPKQVRLGRPLHLGIADAVVAVID